VKEIPFQGVRFNTSWRRFFWVICGIFIDETSKI